MSHKRAAGRNTLGRARSTGMRNAASKAKSVDDAAGSEDSELQLLQRAFFAIQSGVMITNATASDDRIVFVNRAFESITGYTSEEVLGRNPRFLQAGDNGQPILDDLREARRSNGDSIEWTGVLRNYRKDGTLFWNELDAVAVRDKDGRATHHVGIINDVTGREEAKEILKKSEERFRSLVQNASDLITVIDEAGTITYESPSKERILGYGAQELVGRHVLEHVHPDDLEEVSVRFADVLARPGYLSEEPAEFWYRHADGTWRYLESLTANLLEDPGVGSIVITSRDVTGRKLAEEKQREAESLFRSAFEDVAVGMALINADSGCYLQVNRACCEMFGYSEKELLAMTFRDLTHPEDRDASVEYARQVKAGETDSYQHEKRYVGADGRIVWALTSVSIVRNAWGNLHRFVAQMQDVSERKRAEEELKESHDLLQSVMEGTTDAVFVKDLQGRYLMINRAGAGALGRSVGEVIGKDDIELFGAEDGRQVMEEDRKVLAARETRTTENTKTAEGQTRTFLSTKGPYWDGEGNVAGMFGIARDITDRKEAEEALRESEQRLQTIASNLPVITFALDPDGVFTFENGAALKTLGIEPGWSIGRSVFETYAAFPDVLENVRRALSGDEVVATVEIGNMHFHTIYTPQKDENGEVEGVIGVAINITGRRLLEQELEYRSNHDPLTGLANRRFLFDRLSQALRRASRSREPVSMLYLDLDGFKEINDRHGHELGDVLLEAAARRVERCLKPTDTAARIGGDEFVILLEGTGAERASDVARRVEVALGSPFIIKGIEMRTGVSVGLAYTGTGAKDAAQLMREADKAMYRAKREAGSNEV